MRFERNGTGWVMSSVFGGVFSVSRRTGGASSGHDDVEEERPRRRRRGRSSSSCRRRLRLRPYTRTDRHDPGSWRRCLGDRGFDFPPSNSAVNDSSDSCVRPVNSRRQPADPPCTTRPIPRAPAIRVARCPRG